ncbi:MAG: molecular chaperone DnaJ [Actinomycetes bacterium]
MSTKDYLEKDYYKTLGVPKDADAAAIKKAYRKLARQFHPDANKNDRDAEDRFKEVSEAYDVLSDEKRRAEYDEARTLFDAGGFRAPGGARGGGAGGYSFDLGDLFGREPAGGGGGMGDVLGGIFGGGGRRGPRRGADVESEVTLSFRDAVEGVTVPLRLTTQAACASCHGTGARAGTTPRPCPTCGGSGHTARGAGGFALSEPCRECRGRGLVVDDPCPTCHGSGRGSSARVMNVRIPAGVQDGRHIRLKGKGAPGERGGPAGDLLVLVHVKPHPLFGRKGDHLTVSVPVTFPEAVLGAEVKVPTLQGAPVTLKVPAGTANGRTFRVRGRGVRRKDGSHGDLLVTVEVAVPANLSSGAREALESFREATAGDDPRAGLLDSARGE